MKQYPWAKVFRSKTPPDAIDLLAKLLCYTPEHRLKPLEACAHPFFDELRDPNFKLPRGGTPPPLFNFTEEEQKAAGPLLSKLLPECAGASGPPTAADADALVPEPEAE